MVELAIVNHLKEIKFYGVMSAKSYEQSCLFGEESGRT